MTTPRHLRPLLITKIHTPLATTEALSAIAAAAGVLFDWRLDREFGLLAKWTAAPLVVLADGVLRPGPRRRDVYVIGENLDDADIWLRAVEAGAGHVLFLPEAEIFLAEALAAVAAAA